MAYGDFITQVGETVGIVRQHRYGTILMSRFGTVTKINGHGHIYVQSEDKEYRFTKRGDAYKDKWGPSLMHAAQLRNIMASEERRKERVRIAREIEAALKEGWSYSGTFHVSQERVDTLKNLLAEMEKMVDA
jgi:hypothetical protein